MINLIFSFVFTTAGANLFYARLQKAAAINSENIRAARHLEIFLGQTLRFVDKGMECQTGEGTPEVPAMCEGLVLPYLNSLVHLKGRDTSAPLSVNVSPSPPNAGANPCWEGLGLWGSFHHLPVWYPVTFLPSSLPLTLCGFPGWILTLCGSHLGRFHTVFGSVFFSACCRAAARPCLSSPSYVRVAEAKECTFCVAFAENMVVNVGKHFF